MLLRLRYSSFDETRADPNSCQTTGYLFFPSLFFNKINRLKNKDTKAEEETREKVMERLEKLKDLRIIATTSLRTKVWPALTACLSLETNCCLYLCFHETCQFIWIENGCDITGEASGSLSVTDEQNLRIYIASGMGLSLQMVITNLANEINRFLHNALK